jgi:hypothetical protein
MTIGLLPDGMESGIHGAHWIRGFMAFRRGGQAETVMLMVPA